jgi:chaperone BCS1
VEDLKLFLSHLIESQKTQTGIVSIYSWNVNNNYWQCKSKSKVRPMDSVIQPEKTIGKLLGDFDRFLEADTAKFYESHGIPYRRSYLFFGVLVLERHL